MSSKSYTEQEPDLTIVRNCENIVATMKIKDTARESVGS